VFDWLGHLDEQQRAVATFDGGPLRVLAGAGTGKTTALTARVCRLLVDGIPAERVLLLTFTRRAAREMLARSEALLARAGSARPAGRVQGGTFHSVAHRTLRRHAPRLGLSDGFSVLDPADAADVVDLVRDELLSTTTQRRRVPRKGTLLDLYSRTVNTGRPLADVVAEQTPWCVDLVDEVAAVCRGYVQRKRALDLLDFDDLLLYWRVAATDDRLGRSLAGELDHVLVDEYQDVNGLQVDLLRALRGQDDRLTVVGDDAQAVYSFRAADPRHILDFPAVFPGSTTILLETSYRSSPEVLAVANAVGADAPEGFTAVLRAADPCGSSGPRPALVRVADEDLEARAVCDRVLALRESGLALHDQAVLVRAAHHSDLLELELGRRGIPYVKYGGLKFLEAAHVKDLLAAFRLVDNPRDEPAWFRLLQLLEGVGPATARRSVDALGLGVGGDGGAVTDADVLLRWPLACAVLPAAARPTADTLAAALVRQLGESVVTHAERLRQAVAPLVERGYPDAPARLEDLHALVAGAASAARLSDVAADHALEPPRSTGDLAGAPVVDEDWLVLSTVHSAKGLEWEAVHLLHAADGSFPSDLALTSERGVEEERRLFYVAITRPRRHLDVYVPQRFHHRPRRRDDPHSWAQPSRFLSAGVRARLDERVLVHDDAWNPGLADAPGVAPVAAAALVSAQLEGLWGVVEG
jgi:DNA helicase-2/ATP-dependent DNA helicase PcrA